MVRLPTRVKRAIGSEIDRIEDCISGEGLPGLKRLEAQASAVRNICRNLSSEYSETSDLYFRATATWGDLSNTVDRREEVL